MERPLSLEPSSLYDDGALQLAAGIAPATLARARRSGRLRFTQQGKRTLYLGQWILDWLQAESRQGVSHAE
jgi:hypothetical protein